MEDSRALAYPRCQLVSAQVRTGGSTPTQALTDSGAHGVPPTHVGIHDYWGILRAINATIGLGSYACHDNQRLGVGFGERHVGRSLVAPPDECSANCPCPHRVQYSSHMTALGRRASAIICILALLLPLTATPANANTKLGPAPVLGACGVFTPDNKVVYKYWNNTGRTLYCGNDRYGFRHIRKNHRAQFQTLAAIGGLQWWDLMHWAIYYNYKDPDYVRYQGDGKTCRSRSLYLGTRSGKPYSQIFRVITGSNGVITAYPSSKHCQW